MNVLAAQREDGALVVAGGWRVPMPTLRGTGATTLTVGLRPEAIILANDGHPAEVLVSEPLGSEVIVNVKLGDALVKVRTGPDVRPQAGERVGLRADPAGVRVFDRDTGVALA
jgi:multiple sugar transport system ATP-binding protein